MKIAYLVTQYPKISHSFIRRELRAIEREEREPITRISVRRIDEPLVDAEDVEEAERTKVLLDASPTRLAAATVRVAARSPGRFVKALRTTVRLGVRSDRGLLRHLAYLAEACSTLELTDEANVDHVHAHFGTNSAAVALLTHELGGPSYSFTAHGTETFDFPPFIGIRDKVAGAAFVVAVSEYGRSQLCRWSSSEHWDKIHVVRCGADDGFLSMVPTPVPDSDELLCVGRFSPEKGHMVLLQAAAMLAARGVRFRLRLLGDGELRPAIEGFIRDHHLGDVVRLHGWANGEEVRGALREARALVLPSFMEGLPVVLMEAFALGRPVIATAVAGIPELVEPGRNGWLVPAGSVERLAAAMEAAIRTDVGELSRMGAEGRRVVLDRHDATREAARLRELIHRYGDR